VIGANLMKKHTKKMIVPIAIISFIIIFIILQIIPVFMEPFLIDIVPLSIRIPLLLALLTTIGICISMLRERIKEIRSGEEDDLGKY
jgi:c-di-AMP phosphodiesterase-like protein